MARRYGKLLKGESRLTAAIPMDNPYRSCKLTRVRARPAGGEPDTQSVSKILLLDWQRGKIPWFQAPPFTEDKPPAKGGKAAAAAAAAEGRAAAADEAEVPVAPKQTFSKIAPVLEYDEEDSKVPAGQEDEEDEEDLVDWDDVYAKEGDEEDGAEDEEAQPMVTDQKPARAFSAKKADREAAAVPSLVSRLNDAASAPAAESELEGDFVARDSFEGRQVGYVFKNGDSGNGYYKDTFKGNPKRRSGGKSKSGNKSQQTKKRKGRK